MYRVLITSKKNPQDYYLPGLTFETAAAARLFVDAQHYDPNWDDVTLLKVIPRKRRIPAWRNWFVVIAAVTLLGLVGDVPAKAFGPTPIEPPPELADVDVMADCGTDVTCLTRKIAFLFYAANAQGTYTSYWYDQWMANDRIVKAQRRVLARRLAQIKKDRAIIWQLRHRTTVDWRSPR